MTGSSETGVPRAAGSVRADIDAMLAMIAHETERDDPVSAAVCYSIEGGGKRIRGMLCLAAIEAVAPLVSTAAPYEARVRAACAIELIHAYSLVHDDLPCMDNDDLRRGRPTTHRVHGSRTAMAAGIALIPLACRNLMEAARNCGVSHDRARDAVRELCRGAGAAGMVGGQVLDLDAEGHAVDDTVLHMIHTMKTGAMFRASLRIGGILGGAGSGVVDALGRFGEHTGMAFQIMDDVLDVTMDSGALGKTAGKDVEADKATFAARLGVGRARSAAQACIEAASAELASAGVRSPALLELARFAVERDR